MVDALADRLAAGPTRAYAGTKRQLNAWLFARMAEQLELEASIQQESAASGDFAGGRAGVPREAAGRLRRPVTRPLPGRPVHILPTPWGLTQTRRGVAFAGWVQRCPPWSLGALVLAPAASAGWFLPESGGSPNADAIRTLYILIALIGARDLRRRRGPADLLAVQVPRAQGPRRGADPRQHAARDRLDGRRRGDPHLPHRLHVRRCSTTSRTRPRPRSTPRATRSPPTRCYAATDQPAPPEGSASMNIKVIGQQYVWSYFYPQDEGEERRLRLQRHGRAGRHDRHARHPGQGRRALVVDPQARRQDGRGPGLHEQDLVQDPARRDARGRRPRGLRGPVRRAVRAQPRQHARPRDRAAVRRLEAWRDQGEEIDARRGRGARGDGRGAMPSTSGRRGASVKQRTSIAEPRTRRRHARGAESEEDGR